MKRAIRAIAATVLLLTPLLAGSAEIYLCEAYAGGLLWSSGHCNRHKALIKRIANVPDSMPFNQQVEIAKQQRNSADAAGTSSTSSSTTRSTTTTTTSSSSYNPAAAKKAECAALEAQIANYDSMARQPQSAQTQDWISARKRKARDRQFSIKC